jgi:hypothetical protein
LGRIIAREDAEGLTPYAEAAEAQSSPAATQRTQGLTYLRLTGLELGLIINFNTTQLIKGIRRLILSNQPPVVV